MIEGDRAVPARAWVLALFGFLGGCTASIEGPSELTNIHVSPAYSQWLVGPIARLASASELESYLALRDDQAAAAFIEEFWKRRDPYPERPGNPVAELFERRAVEADRAYSEAGYLGRRTDRGTIHVLYGAPEATEYEANPDPEGSPVEVWQYEAGHSEGLDGRRPYAAYRFVKDRDLTVLLHRVPPRPTRRSPTGL